MIIVDISSAPVMVCKFHTPEFNSFLVNGLTNEFIGGYNDSGFNLAIVDLTNPLIPNNISDTVIG